MSANITSAEKSIYQTAILETLHRYANMAREEADFAAMERLWVKDGTFTMPNGLTVGAHSIQDIVRTGQPNYIRHHITTVTIDFRRHDLCCTDTYFIAYTDIAQPDHWGRWRDRLRRQENNEWLFENKSVSVEGYAKVSFWSELLRRVNQSDANGE